MRTLILILLFIPIAGAFSQVKVTLSSKHQQRLSSIEAGHKRMMKFYKFYKRDSIRQLRKESRRAEAAMDSTWKANRLKEKATSKVSKQTEKLKAIAYADTIDSDLNRWRMIYRDSASSDSIKTIARENIRKLAVEKAKLYPGFESAMHRHAVGLDSTSWEKLAAEIPGLDSLSGFFNNSPDELFSVADKSLSDQVGKQFSIPQANGSKLAELEEAARIRRLADQYRESYKKYSDVDQMKKEGKEKAVETATDHFENHTKELQAAQNKVSRLLGKYREFSNSNDLSDAVKNTSLKDKAFKERLLLAANVNVISLDPFSADISPQVGYRFNTRFSAGVGMSYRITFSDSIRSSWYIAPSTTSFDLFASYIFMKGFYAYGEWKRAGLPTQSTEGPTRKWADNYFIGVGKRFLVAPKLYMTLTAMYNLNGEDKNPLYARRLQVRMGFQLSELALRKKKIEYDPNR